MTSPSPPSWAGGTSNLGTVATIQQATEKLAPILLTVGAAGIAISAGMLALGLGWKYFAGLVGGGDDGSNWEADGEIVDSFGSNADGFFDSYYDPITGQDVDW